MGLGACNVVVFSVNDYVRVLLSVSASTAQNQMICRKRLSQQRCHGIFRFNRVHVLSFRCGLVSACNWLAIYLRNRQKTPPILKPRLTH